MSKDELIQAIATWADNEPIIKAAYLYGSRERGDYEPDSDVDVAIEIIGQPSDLGDYGTWVANEQRLKRTLQAAIPFNLHLQWYNPKKTIHIHRGILESSTKAYERNTT